MPDTDSTSSGQVKTSYLDYNTVGSASLQFSVQAQCDHKAITSNILQ